MKLWPFECLKLFQQKSRKLGWAELLWGREEVPWASEPPGLTSDVCCTS